MCLLCTGLRTPDQWLLMELFTNLPYPALWPVLCQGRASCELPTWLGGTQPAGAAWGLAGSNKGERKQSEGPALSLQLHLRPVCHEVSPALHRLVLLRTRLDGDACRIWARQKAMGSQNRSAGAAARQGLTVKSKENTGLSDHPVVSPSSLSLPSWQRESINISLVTTLK